MLDPARDEPTYSFPLSDGIGNRIHSYGSWESTNSGLWASKELNEDDDESSIIPSKDYIESLSPTSRTQAIARGQREMMEMVRNMPESSYELSLKDLVEKTRIEENEIEERKLINENVYRKEGGSGRKVDQTAVKRNGNVYGGGFYLKMMFPTSLGSSKRKTMMKKNKKKNIETSGNENWKGSLRPSASEGCLNLKVGVDEEWWKKSPSASTVDSESGGTSVNSGSSKSSGSSSSSSRSNSRRERRRGGCWFLIGKPKKLTKE